MNLFRNRFLGKIVFFILLFLFVYPFKIIGLPVSFRVLFSLFGGILLGIRLLSLKKIYFSSRIFYLAVVALAVCAMSFFSTYIANQAGDNEYVNFWLLPVLCFLSAYFIISFGFYAFPKLDFILLSKYFIAVVLAQAIISVAMFVNTSIYSGLLQIQQMDKLDMVKSESAIGGRLLGLGASFMIMGVINCVALLLIAILLKKATLSKSFRWYLITAFLVIFAIGMMQARTTIIGFLVSLVYLCFSSFRISALGMKRSSKQVSGMVVVSLLLIAFVLMVAGNFIQKNQYLLQYGFELFVNYQTTGHFSSASTNDLQYMYNIVPTSAKTYLVGDGKFNNVPGVPFYGFYMHTDVGVMRLLFYFGIPGLLLFSLYQFLLVKYSFTVPLSDYRFIIFYFFLFVILWNFKNVMDTNILFTPFCVLNIMLARRNLTGSPRNTEQNVTY